METEAIINIVMKILQSNCAMFIGNKTLIKKYHHIDIDLMMDYNCCCWIQITNCGSNNPDYELFQYICNLNLPIILERTTGNLSSIIFKNKNDNSMKHLSIDRDSIPNPYFSHLKEYYSIKIQHEFSSSELATFKTRLIQHLEELNPQFPNVKLTFRCSEKIFFKNNVELDEIFQNCNLLSSSIVDILRCSVNQEFREQFHEMFETSDSINMKEKLTMRLFTLFHQNYQA